MKKIMCGLLLLGATASGMDYQALGMLETGNHDAQIGTHGEICRFQMLKPNWRKYARKGESRLNPVDAEKVARRYMADLTEQFVEVYHRQPNDFEEYRLWNSPNAILEGQPVTPAVADRATRYRNLVEMYNDERISQRPVTHPAPRLRATNSVSRHP